MPGWGSFACCGQKEKGDDSNHKALLQLGCGKNKLPRNGPMCKPHLEAHSQQSLSDTVKAVHFCAGKYE